MNSDIRLKWVTTQTKNCIFRYIIFEQIFITTEQRMIESTSHSNGIFLEEMDDYVAGKDLFVTMPFLFYLWSFE